MKDRASALLVHDHEYPLRDLRPLLKQGIPGGQQV